MGGWSWQCGRNHGWLDWLIRLPLAVDSLLGGALGSTEKVVAVAAVLGGHIIQKAICLELRACRGAGAQQKRRKLDGVHTASVDSMAQGLRSGISQNVPLWWRTCGAG